MNKACARSSQLNTALVALPGIGTFFYYSTMCKISLLYVNKPLFNFTILLYRKITDVEVKFVTAL